MKYLVFILFVGLNFSGTSQLDTLVPKVEVVGDYGANSYSVIFPLGWSKEGHFAFIHQDMNGTGGAEIYDYKFLIHKHQPGKPEFAMSTTYNYEKDTAHWDTDDIDRLPIDSVFWNYQFFRNYYWPQHQDTINKILDKFNIIRDTLQAVKPIEISKQFGIEFTENRDRDTENAIVLDRSIDIFVKFTGKNKRAIFSKTNALNADGWAIDQYGNYTDILYYQVEGFLKSPYSDNYFMYLVEYTMGYEETAERLILIPFRKNL